MIFGIICCFIPLVIIILLCKFVFKIKLWHQFVTLALGLVAILPISVIQYYLPEITVFATNYPILYTLYKSLIIYGLIEEVFKFAFIIPLPHKNYTELNFLLLSFVMGLSVGCFESVIYYLDFLQRSITMGGNLLYGQIFVRIFTTDIIHMCCTGLCSLFLFSYRSKAPKFWIFILAILLHGLYDFFANFQNAIKFFSYAVILLSIIECRIKYTSLKNASSETESADLQFNE